MNEMRKLIDLLEAIESSQISDEWFQGAKTFAKKGAPESFQIADQDGEVKTLENPKPVPYRKGDYIMTGPKGEQYVIAPEKFQELKVDNGDGTASPKPIPKLAKLADHDGHVVVDWGSGPQKLHYKQGQDVVVRHGANDYGVVKKDIFQQTYGPVAGSVKETTDIIEDWEETAWSDTMPDGTEVTATIQDIMKLAGEPQKMNPQQFASVRVQPESEERMMKADLSYPLLVLQHTSGKYHVLDGNHRLAKALHTKQPDVLVRMVKFESLPEQWQWLFNHLCGW